MIAKEIRIYKASFDLANYLFRITNKFSRETRPTLARRIEDSVLNLGKVIIEANEDIENRSTILAVKFSIEYENLQFLVNLAVSQQQISFKQHAFISRSLEDIGVQALGWKKAADKRKLK